MAGVLSYALSLKTSAFTGPLAGATTAMRGLTGAASTAASVIGKMAGPLAALGGGLSAFAAISKAASFETLSVSMRVLIGDAKEAQRVMADLKTFSNSTPFEFSDIADAGKTLIALGANTKTVVAELSALGDIASGLSIPLGELAIAYGKARNDGVLYAETLNQFNDKGIPVFAKLAAMLNVSTVEIKKMAAEGQITFPQLQKVISDLTAEGGQFFGLMQQQAGTTKGLLSTLKSALDELLVSVGTPINDFLKPILSANIGRMQALNVRVAALLKLLAAAKEQGQLGEFIGNGLQLAMVDAINVFSSGLRGTVAFLSESMIGILSSFSTGLRESGITDFFTYLAKSLGYTISSAIVGALSFIPGLGDLSEQARVNAQLAATYMETAGIQLGAIDLGKGLKAAGSEFAAAVEAGKKAAADASGTPLIDRNPSVTQFKNLGASLNPQAINDLLNPPVAAVAKQGEALEKALGSLNTALGETAKKATKKPEEPAFPIGDPAGAERPGGRPRGLLDAAASAAARLARRSDADKARDARLGRDGLSQADRLGLQNEARRAQRTPNFINPARAAAALARGNGNADPGRGRREEKAEAARKASDPLYRVTSDILKTFSNLASA